MRALDISAVSLSFICLIHCLAIPFLVTVAPVMAPALAHGGATHMAMFAMAAPISIIGLWLAARRTRPGARIVTFAIAGLGLMFAGTFESVIADFGDTLTITGVALLAVVHVVNWRRFVVSQRA